MRIIDIHCHLGDILFPGGGSVIESETPMAKPFDPDWPRRRLLYRMPDNWLYTRPVMQRLMSRAERLRNFTATRRNLARAMDRYGVEAAVALPVAPNTTLEDLLRATQADRRLVPFGSFDFTAPDIRGQALRQLNAGARGFKLHPILQRVPPDGQQTREALSALPAGTVVLLHTGEANYYPSKDAHLQAPEYGRVEGAAALCRGFPELAFIAAHGGLRQFQEFITLLPGLPNVHADTTFLSPEGIRALIDAFGAERVLFGSDWPYGFQRTALQCVRAACRGKENGLEAILAGNAARLLGISISPM